MHIQSIPSDIRRLQTVKTAASAVLLADGFVGPAGLRHR
jgi:hypothetical protein